MPWRDSAAVSNVSKYISRNGVYPVDSNEYGTDWYNEEEIRLYKYAGFIILCKRKICNILYINHLITNCGYIIK